MKEDRGRNKYPIPKEIESRINTASVVVIHSPDSVISTIKSIDVRKLIDDKMSYGLTYYFAVLSYA